MLSSAQLCFALVSITPGSAQATHALPCALRLWGLLRRRSSWLPSNGLCRLMAASTQCCEGNSPQWQVCFPPRGRPAIELSSNPQKQNPVEPRRRVSQVREFKPQLVAIKGDRVAELKELLRGAPLMPEVVVGDAGIVEVASHRDADSVVTGAPLNPCPESFSSDNYHTPRGSTLEPH